MLWAGCADEVGAPLMAEGQVDGDVSWSRVLSARRGARVSGPAGPPRAGDGAMAPSDGAGGGHAVLRAESSTPARRASWRSTSRGRGRRGPSSRGCASEILGTDVRALLVPLPRPQDVAGAEQARQRRPRTSTRGSGACRQEEATMVAVGHARSDLDARGAGESRTTRARTSGGARSRALGATTASRPRSSSTERDGSGVWTPRLPTPRRSPSISRILHVAWWHSEYSVGQ